ncbi:MAG: hypothetical protein FWD94_00600 [Treponema sp.]|nr:hypothetical protein [Treponema sp.]
MKNKSAKFVCYFLTAAACVFLAACINPIVEKWWGHHDDGNTVILVRGVRIHDILYVEFSGNSIEYNGDAVPPATSSLSNLQKDANNDAIKRVLDRLGDNPDWLVQVTGHANPTIGSMEEVTELHVISAERARVIIQVLMGNNSQHPVTSPTSRTQIINGGYSDNLFTDDQSHGGSNRCVELIVLELLDPEAE